MPKWIVLSRLWSLSQQKNFEPGDEIEYSDAEAAELVRQNLLMPAQVKRTAKPRGAKEKSNDTNH